jgi:ubiquinone/menaquinone biosynthesis C-methylase UbiE
MSTEDHCLETVATFDKFAQRYADKYFALDIYDRFYQMFADRIPRGPASVVDIACGPGNVAAWLTRVRPDISVVGVDLSNSMLEQARAEVHRLVESYGYRIEHEEVIASPANAPVRTNDLILVASRIRTASR